MTYLAQFGVCNVERIHFMITNNYHLWGMDLYDNMSLENAWYRVDGDWYLGQNNYIWNRSMIYGFSVL